MIRSILTFSLLLLPVSALAQPSDAQREAEKRFEEGKTLFNQRKYSEARNRFLEACAVLKQVSCPKNLGVTEVELGMFPEAAGHFRDYLADSRSNADPVRKEIEQEYAKAKAKVCELDISAPRGASVRVNATTLGAAPLSATTFVTPGKAEVTATWGEAASEKKTENVDAVAGATIKVEIKGPETSHDNPPPPGHTEKVRPASGWVVPIVLGVAGAAGLVLGVGMGAASTGKKDDAMKFAGTGVCTDMSAPSCAPYQSARSDGGTLGAVSVVGYIAGGLLLAGAITAFVIWPKQERQVGLVIGPTGGGLVGSF
jgi:hypothetical protein